MSLLNVFNVAGSAMTAQSKRLNVVASNLANAESTSGPDGQPYRAKQVQFMAAPVAGTLSTGVKVDKVVEDQTPPKLVYNPAHPQANEHRLMSLTN